MDGEGQTQSLRVTAHRRRGRRDGSINDWRTLHPSHCFRTQAAVAAQSGPGLRQFRKQMRADQSSVSSTGRHGTGAGPAAEGLCWERHRRRAWRRESLSLLRHGSGAGSDWPVCVRLGLTRRPQPVWACTVPVLDAGTVASGHFTSDSAIRVHCAMLCRLENSPKRLYPKNGYPSTASPARAGSQPDCGSSSMPHNPQAAPPSKDRSATQAALLGLPRRPPAEHHIAAAAQFDRTSPGRQGPS
jgi:hypothetical protein